MANLFEIDTIGNASVSDTVDLTNNCFINKTEERKKIDFSKIDHDEVKKILAKATLTPTFDKLAVVDAAVKSKRKQKLERKKIRESTAGENWFNMSKSELTEERRKDLELLQMRNVIDPTVHYRKKDLNVLPKYFEVGRIVDNPADYYSSRIPKKARKQTMIDEMMDNVELVAKAKKRYTDILLRKKAVRRGTFQNKTFLSKRSKYKNKKRSH